MGHDEKEPGPSGRLDYLPLARLEHIARVVTAEPKQPPRRVVADWREHDGEEDGQRREDEKLRVVEHVRPVADRRPAHLVTGTATWTVAMATDVCYEGVARRSASSRTGD